MWLQRNKIMNKSSWECFVIALKIQFSSWLGCSNGNVLVGLQPSNFWQVLVQFELKNLKNYIFNQNRILNCDSFSGEGVFHVWLLFGKRETLLEMYHHSTISSVACCLMNIFLKLPKKWTPVPQHKYVLRKQNSEKVEKVENNITKRVEKLENNIPK